MLLTRKLFSYFSLFLVLSLVGPAVLSGKSLVYASPAPVPISAAQSVLNKAGPLGDRTLGNPKAPLVLVEYASFTCPHCILFQKEIFPIIKRDYIDKGLVLYIFRDFPLDSLSLKASTYARCMPAKVYFGYVDRIFDIHEDWSSTPRPEVIAQGIEDATARSGFTQVQMQRCMADKAVENHLKLVYNKAKEDLHVTGTPTFFLNGERLMVPELLPHLKASAAKVQPVSDSKA